MWLLSIDGLGREVHKSLQRRHKQVVHDDKFCPASVFVRLAANHSKKEDCDGSANVVAQKWEVHLHTHAIDNRFEIVENRKGSYS